MKVLMPPEEQSPEAPGAEHCPCLTLFSFAQGHGTRRGRNGWVLCNPGLLLEPNYLFSETQTTSLYPSRPESLQVELSQRVWFGYLSQNTSRPI